MWREIAVRRSQVRRLRAQRYDIRATILYRGRGDGRWHEGMIENVSASGVLLRAKQSVGPGTSLEMRFALPIELSGEGGAQVFCRGAVVRASVSSVFPDSVLVATTIDHSRLIHNGSM
jgi:hypothetical protein